MRLKDKVAVVTGAGAGIGRAIAALFGKEGAAVVCADISEEKATLSAQAIQAAGGQALAVRCDVSSSAQVDALVTAASRAFGGLDIWVNNAGILGICPFVETTDEEFDRIQRVNLYGTFYGARAAARQMVKQARGGRIINISSVHATLSEPNATPYTASKGGIEAMSRTVATELARAGSGITCNCIAPGATYTELSKPIYTPPIVEALKQWIPLGIIAEPEWVAAGAVFLASDDARYITGTVLAIDGGIAMDGTLPGATNYS